MRTDASSLEEQVGIAAMIGIFIAAAAFLGCPGLTLEIPVIMVAALLGSAMHEFAHVAASRALGDRTAADEGRFTLNPLTHLHPVGTLLFLTIGIGWARPVSLAPDSLRFGRWGMALVAAAGPLTNLTIFLACMAVNFRVPNPPEAGVAGLVDQVALANFLLFGLNILPLHPFDGGKVLRAFVLERWIRGFDVLSLGGGVCVITFLFSAWFVERIAEQALILVLLAPFLLILAVISISIFGLLRRLLAWVAAGCERGLGMSDRCLSEYRNIQRRTPQC